MNTIDAVISAANCEAFDFLPDLIGIVRPNGSYIYFNKAWRKHTANTAQDFASPEWIKCVHPADRRDVETAIQLSYGNGQPQETEFRIEAQSSNPQWFLLRTAPHADEDGRVLFWLHILTCLHKEKADDLALRHTARMRMEMLNVSTDCIKLINTDGTLAHMNEAGCTALCVPQDSDFGMDWLGLLPPEIGEPGREALKKARNGICNRFFGISQTPGESPRYWDNMLTPLLTPAGEVEAILCVSRDVTAAHHDEQRIGMLLREVSHRARNMLTVIRALMRRTVPDPHEEFVSILDKRITSIARSQDLLVQDHWTGATVQHVVVAQTVTVGDERSQRLHIDGDPTIKLRPEAAEKIGLAIHELTTNAVRHGAFSNPVGTVSVAWNIEKQDGERFFRMRWKEEGGPPISEPLRKGFGTALIERNPRGVNGAVVVYRAEPDGILWEFTAPTSGALTFS
ncbi:sensor histidine kinase [Acetobacter conturbans]|nr:PAS domain-containing protein [Acetobacter conturbans]